jgi:hypothetical protein
VQRAGDPGRDLDAAKASSVLEDLSGEHQFIHVRRVENPRR